MAPRIPGLPVALIALGGVLVYSGVENQPVAAIFRGLAAGLPPAPGPKETYATTATAAGLQIGVPGGLASLGDGTGEGIASDALRYRGAGYVWAGAPAQGTGHWDCSSFANWVVGHDEGLAIPGWGAGKYDGSTHGPATGSWLIWTGATTVGHNGNQAQAGDLAVWQTHMGICLGPDQMISAQDPKQGTQVSGINGFIPEILFIRRLRAVAAAGPAPGKLATV